MKGSYLGTEYNQEIEKELKAAGANFETLELRGINR